MALRPLQVVVEQYVDNIAYINAPGCQLFLSAARELLLRRPKKTMIDGQVVEFDQQAIQNQINDAQRWLASQANATNPNSGAQYYDVSRIRG